MKLLPVSVIKIVKHKIYEAILWLVTIVPSRKEARKRPGRNPKFGCLWCGAKQDHYLQRQVYWASLNQQSKASEECSGCPVVVCSSNVRRPSIPFWKWCTVFCSLSHCSTVPSMQILSIEITLIIVLILGLENKNISGGDRFKYWI